VVSESRVTCKPSANFGLHRSLGSRVTPLYVTDRQNDYFVTIGNEMIVKCPTVMPVILCCESTGFSGTIVTNVDSVE